MALRYSGLVNCSLISNLAASLVKRAYTFAEIRLGLPYGLAWVRADGSLNLAELGSSSDSQDVPPEPNC